MAVGVCVAVAVAAAVAVAVGVFDAVGVAVAVAVAAAVGVVVGVGVTVGVAVGVLTVACSNAPMSQRALPLPSPSKGRTVPSWSVAAQAAPPLPGADGFPASMAGLLVSRGWTQVAPIAWAPPKIGSRGDATVPVTSPVAATQLQPSAAPTRL